MRAVWVAIAAMAAGCNALLGLDKPALGTDASGGGDDVSDGPRDGLVEMPCTPSSFAGGTVQPILTSTVQRFQIASDESFAILTINASIEYITEPNDSSPTPIPAEGFPTGTNNQIALTPENDQLFLNNINNSTITRSTVVTPPGIWNNPTTEQGFNMATVGHPSAAAARMVTSSSMPDLLEYTEMNNVWIPIITHPRADLIDGSGIGALQAPSLTADGLGMVYIITGGPVAGINYATRSGTDQTFARADLLFPGTNIIGAQLTASCNHLWVLQTGGVLTRVAH